MMTSHGFASMVIANIAQTLDACMIVVNVGRRTSMSDLSELINRGGLIDDFKIEKSKDEPPTQPIKLADWLIDRELKDGIRLYGKNDLRKIANYLLNYCGDEND
jgi:hypothetical protein